MSPFEISVDANASRAGYALRAWLIAAIPGLITYFALVGAGVETLRPARAFDVVFAGYSILVAPLLETALTFPIASLLTLLIPRRAWIRIVLLAAICALAHRIGGSWNQVFASFWPFLIYSLTLTAWRTRSDAVAFALTALVHALYNATFFAVGMLGVLLTAPD